MQIVATVVREMNFLRRTVGQVIVASAIIGDSIGYSGNDASDPVSCARFMERAMRNVLPIMNLARSGDTFTDYLANPAGRALLLSGRINRLICELGTNDTFAGTTPTLAAMQALATAAWAPFLAAGVKVWQSTLTPRTTSTDGWSTTANQTIVSAAAEALRQSFNAWIIASWATLGLSGYLDYGHAVDPTDSGVWNADGTTGTSAAGFCNLVGGSVSGCTLAQYNIGTSNGLSYPNSTTVACTVRGYPGETGTLPTITAQTGGTGLVTGFTIISPGANLLYPPMVAPNGAWTVDGTHPNPRGYNE